MTTLITNNFLLLPIFGFCVFIFSYLMSDKIFIFFKNKSFESREMVQGTLDKMFVKTDKKRVTIIMLLMSFGVGGFVFLLAWPNVIVGLFLGSVFIYLGWSLPKVAMVSLWEKRCSKITNQMLDGMVLMGNGVKAGLGIAQSMERVTENMTGPLAQEFGLVLNKTRLGMSLEEALNEFGDRIPRQDVQMFVTSVNILKETGGNLSETFATIVETIRERQKIEKKIEAMTAQGVMQGIIMTLVPFFLFVVFFVIDPNYISPLINTPLGWVTLGIMLGLQIIGGIMIKKIVTIKV